MMERRERLEKRRALMGFTQESLAARLGLAVSTVGRWERGTGTPQPWNQPDLAKALDVSLDSLADLLCPAQAADGDRVSQSMLHPAQLDVITVAHLRQRVQSLDQQYDRVPSTALIADAGHVLGQIAFLSHHAPGGRARRELCCVEAEAATLMGQLVWDASQRRDHVNARRYFDQAIRAAREVGDIAAEGHALLRTSYLALYGEKDPFAGLQLTNLTADTTHRTSHTLTGLALLHAAEANAMLGDTAACEAALSQAESRFDRIASSDGAEHLYSPTQFNRLAGSCYLFLGDHRRAQQILEQAARATVRRSNKSHAIVLGNLSLAHLGQRQLDAATATLNEAIDVVEATRGGGGLNVIFDAGRALREWRDEPLVQDVYDRLLSLMTVA
ncbi:helix-turn-helix domain-containing protein [Amycolatopsis sp. NPDC059657]|uniref:helix-turn-helix domain-containing protein n=1 Tax=Amycolatopsis sp. NPDC059657 TaxID=3346899 RepID=UPI00366E2B3A